MTPQEQFIKECILGNDLGRVARLLKDPEVSPVTHSLREHGEPDPLQFACTVGYKALVKLLLEDGRADPAEDDSYAMVAAAENDHDDVVKMLIADGRACPFADETSDEIDALEVATERGHYVVMSIFMQDQRLTAKSLDIACMTAGRQGDEQALRILLQDPRASRAICFASACDSGHLAIVEMLAADVSQNTELIARGLIKATQFGYGDIFDYLMDMGCTTFEFGALRAIHFAAMNGSTRMLARLLSCPGAKVVHDDLMAAIQRRSADCVQLLLAHSADLDPSADDCAALRLAASVGSRKIAELLCADGRVSTYHAAKNLLALSTKNAISVTHF